jgi:predicted 3-demethylubiquinone-9 3-methyltransferase (glyoxalase superfamily)
VFKPSKGEPTISTYDGKMITAGDAFDHYTRTLHNKSCGVVAVSNEECISHGLLVIEDRVPFPEHISINYGDKSRNEIDRIASQLKRKATARGWLFGPIY